MIYGTNENESKGLEEEKNLLIQSSSPVFLLLALLKVIVQLLRDDLLLKSICLPAAISEHAQIFHVVNKLLIF